MVLMRACDTFKHSDSALIFRQNGLKPPAGLRAAEPLTVDPHQLGDLPPGVAPHVQVSVRRRAAVVQTREPGDRRDEPVFHVKTEGNKRSSEQLWTTTANSERTSASGAKHHRYWLPLALVSPGGARSLLKHEASLLSRMVSSLIHRSIRVQVLLDLLPGGSPLRGRSPDPLHLLWSSSASSLHLQLCLLFRQHVRACAHTVSFLLFCLFINLKSDFFVSLFPLFSSSFSPAFFYSCASPPQGWGWNWV